MGIEASDSLAQSITLGHFRLMINRRDIEEAFRPSREAIEEAFDQAVRFREEVDAFKATLDFQIFEELDEATGDTLARYRLNGKIPRRFRTRAEKALVGTREAYDKIVNNAHAILCPDEQKLPKGRRPKRYYPFASSKAAMDHALKTNKIDERLWPLFDRLHCFDDAEVAEANADLRRLAAYATRKHSIGFEAQVTPLGSRHDCIDATGPIEHITMVNDWDSVRLEGTFCRYKGEGVLVSAGEFQFVLALVGEELERPFAAVQSIAWYLRECESKYRGFVSEFLSNENLT